MKKENRNANYIQPESFAQEEKSKQQPVWKCCSSSRLRITKNLLVVCFGFFFLFLPYVSLTNLQSTLNFENNVGVISQAVLYATIILSSLFLSKLLIKKFGCKNTFILGILAFLPYFAANFYPNMTTFIPSAVLVGIGNGPLWTALSTYINEISASYAAIGKDSADVITSKFFGIFFMMYQNTQIWGSLVSFYLLKPRDFESTRESLFSPNNTSFPSLADSLSGFENVSCGAEFCGGMNENLLPPSEDKVYMLIGVYLCCVLLSALNIFLFLDPLKQSDDNGISESSFYSTALATLKHLSNTDQLLLVPLTIFVGIEQAFIYGDFSQSFVACAWGLHNVCLVFICFGVMSATMSFLSGRLVKYIPRLALTLTAAAGNIGVCIVLLLWRPNSDEFIYFFILAGLWGTSEAIWLTQIFALYGVLFRANEEAAFSNFMVWECVGFSLAFGYSIFLCVADRIYVLLAFLMVGIFGYVTVEIRNSVWRKVYSVSET